ncbi:MAG: glycosyltransferase family 1 protein [Armatimonadota bacterium]|nr:glycosyltransferase family 1 protein [Armatimonadota bacterium]
MPGIKVVIESQIALAENSLSRYIRGLVSALAATDLGVEPCLLFSSPRPASAVRQAHPWIPDNVGLSLLRGPESPYEIKRLQWLYWQCVLWPRACRRAGAEVFHSQYNRVPLVGRCPVATTVHDVFQWVPALGRTRGKKDRIRLVWERHRYRRARVVVADSRNTRADFLRYVDPRHPDVDVVYPGVDPTFQAAPAPHDPVVLARQGIGDAPYIFYVGDLQPRKDVPTLLRAFSAVRRSLRPPHLLVIGGGSWGQRVLEHQLAEELELGDSVLFTGRVAESYLPTLYRHARFFVFPSLYEGFGFPPLEAMACGTPPVTFNIGGCTDAVRHLVTGYVVPAVDARSLATGIETLLREESLRLSLGRQCRQVVVAEYGVVLEASRFRDLYVELLGATRARKP